VGFPRGGHTKPLVGGGEASGDSAGGVAVEVVAGAVVAAGGAGVGVAGGVLDVSEGCAGVEGVGDEGVP
jgi:hypothetical protein